MQASSQQLHPREIKICLLAMRPGGHPAELLARLEEPGLDWERLEAFARPHGLLPFLFPAVKRAGAGRVPSQFLHRWRDLSRLSSLRSLRLSQELLALQALFQPAGLEMLVLRGPALAALVYPDPSLRLFSDLDVLIRPQGFPQVYELLVSAGYSAAFPLDPQQQRWLVRGDRNFSFRSQEAVLEVHWTIEEPAFRYPLRMERFWRSRRSVPILHGQVETLGEFEMLLQLCLHGTRHRWEKLVWLADLAWFASAQPAFDWEQFWQRAGALGFRRVCGLSLWLAKELAGLCLPAPLCQAISREAAVLRLAGEIQAGLLAGPAARLPGGRREIPARQAIFDLGYALSLRENRLWRTLLLFDRLFTPRQSDWLTLRLPGSLYPLYYGYRPLRLLASLLSGRAP